MLSLEHIHSPEDVKQLNHEELVDLCAQLRKRMIDVVSRTGGHLASNLGTVELTVALHRAFTTPHDVIVWDVGHQCYAHKLLTDRYEGFDRLRQQGGVSGFPNPAESEHDAFVAGHSSTSISVANGIAKAKALTGDDGYTVAVIGDGALTGGLAYEGLSNAGRSEDRLIVVLNDNKMSISRNVGFVARYLSGLRSRKRYVHSKQRTFHILMRIPLIGKPLIAVIQWIKDKLKRSVLKGTTFFEDMGFRYIGPVDGHDLPMLIQTLKAARDMGKPVLVHVITHKGHGYSPAEKDPSRFHGVGKFNPVNGKGLSAKKTTFSDIFGETMVELAKDNPKLCAITAAMPGGTGLLSFKEQFPGRLYDVGIAEEHAVSMAGGLAKQGAVPVVALYSTFLQRSYDQIIQDIALDRLHVVLAVDRAGLVGEDGPTHHGVFDVGFLSQIPGMTVLCPASHQELKDMLRWAVNDCAGPVAIRYPRGGEGSYQNSAFAGDVSAIEVLREGNDLTLITYGTEINEVLKAADLLESNGIQVQVLRLLSANRFEQNSLAKLVRGTVIMVEEAAAGSGMKERIGWALPNSRIFGIDLGENFIPHGDMTSLLHKYGLDGESIAKFAREV